MNLNIVYDIPYINAKVDYLNSKLSTTFYIHALIIIRKFSRPRAPWLTENVKLMMNLRDEGLTRYQAFQNKRLLELLQIT